MRRWSRKIYVLGGGRGRPDDSVSLYPDGKSVRIHQQDRMTPSPTYGRRFVMTILKKRLAVLALGLAVTALASPSYAQGAGRHSARRARPPFRTAATSTTPKIGRASCRERTEISVEVLAETQE